MARAMAWARARARARTRGLISMQFQGSFNAWVHAVS